VQFFCPTLYSIADCSIERENTLSVSVCTFDSRVVSNTELQAVAVDNSGHYPLGRRVPVYMQKRCSTKVLPHKIDSLGRLLAAVPEASRSGAELRPARDACCRSLGRS